MTRRSQQPRREQQKAERETQSVLTDQTRGVYVPPPRNECEEKSWEQSADAADTIRVSVHIWRQGAKIVDFALILQVPNLAGIWAEIGRMDCCHGHAHLHHKSGFISTSTPLHSVDDVRNAFDVANTRIMDYATTIRDMRDNDDD